MKTVVGFSATVKLPEEPVRPLSVAVNDVLCASYRVIPVAVPTPEVKSIETDGVGVAPLGLLDGPESATVLEPE